ncbi:sensor histidine kinase [Actinomadura sp. KC06]|uniref:sensor histidine kinase n=1 Tax=Actinomadura sp. KC06 TaxID=2530369 RepID=UPI001FB56EA2|nr:sensor histidine kinase [Actinomadura sp. KC06]
MRSRTAWQALTDRGFLVTAWPWRATAYLLTGTLAGALELVLLSTALTLGIVLGIVLVGVPLLLALGLCGLPVAAAERRRLRLVDLEPAPGPHRDPERPGFWPWLRTRYREQATWRDLAFTLLSAAVLWPVELAALVTGLAVPAALLTAPAIMAADPDGELRLLKTWTLTSAWQAWVILPLGVLSLLVGMYLVTVVAAARGALTRLLLVAPREPELTERVDELTRSRARLVDAFEAERRRIERDLHDGAQQRLVALTMTLGLARTTTGRETGELVDKAHAEARLALDELRELIRGIHPKLLTDRGLPAAVDELAGRSPVPVKAELDLLGRLPEPVESALYFAVCEALANVAKHSAATTAWVTAGRDGDRVTVEIGDDGVGGAAAARGTGLAGLVDRISVVGGTLDLYSPPGGPTLVRLEVPCGPIDRSA